MVSHVDRSPTDRARQTINRLKYKRKDGGRGWDRTSDPYDVNVVLSR